MYTVQESYFRVVDMPVSVLLTRDAIFLTYHSAIYGFVELREQTIQPKARTLLHCMSSSTVGTYLYTLTRNLYPAYIFLSQCGPKN